MQNLHELFIDQLKDVHNAEKQLTKALPKMAKAAHSPHLRNAFETHLEQTKEHVARIEAVFEELGEKPGRKTCAAMEGLVEEGSEMIEEDAPPAVLDAGLIAAAQRVEHYEIAAYGTLRSFAKSLGHASAMALLERTLKEEQETDQLLTDLAESEINAQALSVEGEGEDGASKPGRHRKATRHAKA